MKSSRKPTSAPQTLIQRAAKQHASLQAWRNSAAGRAPAIPVRPTPTLPKVLQAKTAAPQRPSPSAQRQTPKAPPAYQPHPRPMCLQAKPALQRPPIVSGAKQGQPPSPPPAYRPQPVPKVLQLKSAAPVSQAKGRLQPTKGQPPASPARPSGIAPVRAQSVPAATRRLLNPRQAGAIQRITGIAQKDLEAAERNFKYFSQRGQKFCERGIETTGLIKNMVDEKKQEKLADAIRRFTQTVGEQFEGHYQELRETHRLGTKPKPVHALFSVNKSEDADLAYDKTNKSGKKTITTTTAKELKAISTDNPGAVTNVLKDASGQLELREADKKKAVIIITEPTNTWPVHGNKKNPTVTDMKKAFEKQIKKLEQSAATHIEVQGISVDNEIYAASAKRTGKSSKTGKSSFTYTFEQMAKHPGEPSPLKVASTSSGNQTKSNQKSGSGSDSDSS